MSILLIDIVISIRVRKRILARETLFNREDKNSQRQKVLQTQMFTLMLASIVIFLITSLPLAIYRIQSPRQANLTADVFQVISIWVGLGWFQSLFFAVNLTVSSAIR